MADDDLTKLDELLETTGMPDRTVEYIDDLDKFYRDRGFLSVKQREKIREMWDKYVRDE